MSRDLFHSSIDGVYEFFLRYFIIYVVVKKKRDEKRGRFFNLNVSACVLFLKNFSLCVCRQKQASDFANISIIYLQV